MADTRVGEGAARTHTDRLKDNWFLLVRACNSSKRKCKDGRIDHGNGKRKLKKDRRVF